MFVACIMYRFPFLSRPVATDFFEATRPHTKSKHPPQTNIASPQADQGWPIWYLFRICILYFCRVQVARPHFHQLSSQGHVETRTRILGGGLRRQECSGNQDPKPAAPSGTTGQILLRYSCLFNNLDLELNGRAFSFAGSNLGAGSNLSRKVSLDLDFDMSE